MGSGSYSTTSYTARNATRKGLSDSQVFVSRSMDPEMDPKKATIRESRDSDEHPLSIPIIIGLDVTGSMMGIPKDITRNTLPHLMETLMTGGIAHPQVMFCACGDHVYDSAPLQVGQFESSDELMDKWLTKVYLEGNGGGNDGESYHLIHHFAGCYTTHDHMEKRNRKGWLFTIGDEKCLKEIPGSRKAAMFNNPQDANTTTVQQAIESAREKYEVFHIHVDHDDGWGSRSTETVVASWRELLGQRALVVKDHKEIPSLIAQVILDNTPSIMEPEHSIPSGHCPDFEYDILKD